MFGDRYGEVVEFGVGWLLVWRDGVMHECGDAVVAQVLLQSVALFAENGINMPVA